MCSLLTVCTEVGQSSELTQTQGVLNGTMDCSHARTREGKEADAEAFLKSAPATSRGMKKDLNMVRDQDGAGGSSASSTVLQ